MSGPVYTADFADVYEPLYRHRGKNWEREAEQVIDLLRQRRPEAVSLLDVACGTGTHLATFGRLLPRVEGLEIAEAMRDAARHRLPGVPIHAGDMRDFALGSRFDAVTCLFNSIAYVGDLAEMRAAVACMAAHLEPGGVLVMEPWWFPERFLDGHLACDAGEVEGRAIARVSRSTRHGRRSRLEARFLIAAPDGIKEFTHVHNLMLFTEDEYLGAFADAHITATFHEGGLTGRGLFVGVRD
jgi:SAM-dependent methyltransferase